jgi:hypothetical protein
MVTDFENDEFKLTRDQTYSVTKTQEDGSNLVLGKATALDVHVNGWTRWVIDPWCGRKDHGRYESWEKAAAKLYAIHLEHQANYPKDIISPLEQAVIDVITGTYGGQGPLLTPTVPIDTDKFKALADAATEARLPWEQLT